MGIGVDYFAADDEQLSRMTLGDSPERNGVPYVDCKGFIDGLEPLTAELTGRDRSEFGDEVVIYEEDEQGPWTVRVPAEVTAALASVDDARLREYADDELHEEFEVERYTALRDLARGAVEKGQTVYYWTCV